MELLLFLGQTVFYDAIILSSVSWIVKISIPISKFITAILLNVFLSLLFYLTFEWLIFFVPFVTIYVAFSSVKLKQYCINVIYFYAMTAFLSGVIHIMRYFVNFDGLALGVFLILSVVLFICIAVVFMLKTRFLNKVHTLSEFEHRVTFYCGDASATGIGFVDTGNSLIDQVTQLPVMIVPRKKVGAIDKLLATGEVKTWELGFSVVGQEKAKMWAFRPTLLLIDDVIVKDVIVGICETTFAQYDFLLQPEITIGRGVF